MKKKKYYLFEMNMNALNVVSILLFILPVLLTLLFYKIGVIDNWNYPMGLIFILMVPAALGFAAFLRSVGAQAQAEHKGFVRPTERKGRYRRKYITY